jgi:hypothetical protein
MTNTYYFGCAARSEGGAAHFDVNTKKQVEFKKFNLLGGFECSSGNEPFSRYSTSGRPVYKRFGLLGRPVGYIIFQLQP